MEYLALIGGALGLFIVTLWMLGCPFGALIGNVIDYLRWRYSTR